MSFETTSYDVVEYYLLYCGRMILYRLRSEIKLLWCCQKESELKLLKLDFPASSYMKGVLEMFTGARRNGVKLIRKQCML